MFKTTILSENLILNSLFTQMFTLNCIWRGVIPPFVQQMSLVGSGGRNAATHAKEICLSQGGRESSGKDFSRAAMALVRREGWWEGGLELKALWHIGL